MESVGAVSKIFWLQNHSVLSISLTAKGGMTILIFAGLGGVPGLHELLGLKPGRFWTNRDSWSHSLMKPYTQPVRCSLRSICLGCLGLGNKGCCPHEGRRAGICCSIPATPPPLPVPVYELIFSQVSICWTRLWRTCNCPVFFNTDEST